MDELSHTLYAEVRRLVANQLRRDRAQLSISAADLVHDVWVRGKRAGSFAGISRAELLRRAARICRQVLIDHARHRRRIKRGGGAKPVPLVEVAADRSVPQLDLIALDEALEHLAQLDERQAGVVEMKYFGGFTNAEIAAATGVATRTVESDWFKARAWLGRALAEDGGRDGL